MYRKHDAEFIVNRFRYGSLGMTASMDESGLAAFLVKIASNPPRVEGVFKRLQSAHWSDADDVANLFVKKMKERKNAVMAMVAKQKPSLIKPLSKCLDERWTTGGEYKMMDYLKAL